MNLQKGGLTRYLKCKESCQCRRWNRRGFNSWVGKIPWSRKWQPTPVLSGKAHGQRSLEGYSPWGHNESDTTEWLNTHTHTKGHYKLLRKHKTEGTKLVLENKKRLCGIWNPNAKKTNRNLPRKGRKKKGKFLPTKRTVLRLWVCLFNKHSLNTCNVPGCVLGIWDIHSKKERPYINYFQHMVSS